MDSFLEKKVNLKETLEYVDFLSWGFIMLHATPSNFNYPNTDYSSAHKGCFG